MQVTRNSVSQMHTSLQELPGFGSVESVQRCMLLCHRCSCRCRCRCLCWCWRYACVYFNLLVPLFWTARFLARCRTRRLLCDVLAPFFRPLGPDVARRWRRRNRLRRLVRRVGRRIRGPRLRRGCTDCRRSPRTLPCAAHEVSARPFVEIRDRRIPLFWGGGGGHCCSVTACARKNFQFIFAPKTRHTTKKTRAKQINATE